MCKDIKAGTQKDPILEKVWFYCVWMANFGMSKDTAARHKDLVKISLPTIKKDEL